MAESLGAGEKEWLNRWGLEGEPVKLVLVFGALFRKKRPGAANNLFLLWKAGVVSKPQYTVSRLLRYRTVEKTSS